MSDTDLIAGETSTLTITFDEAVTGFDNTDVTSDNGTLTTLTSSDGGVTWTATFTPGDYIEDATNVITVSDNWTDLKLNPATSGGTSGKLHHRYLGARRSPASR